MSDWLAADRTDLAAERILDAAAELYSERGIAAVGMADVARAAGCSRATLYRYFENRRALQVALVHRETRRIGSAVRADIADVHDPGERIVAVVESALARVRAEPLLVMWFRTDNAGITSDLANSSAVIEGFAANFFAGLGISDADPSPAARWFVRVIVSLLAMPGADAAEERTMLEQFVVPAVLGRIPS
ncbi:TetR/AcrR family transcriptional regulator [Aldersonia sp. NBC_00410]|uniref:TetR/AcrR family transcriptional regulator n=1 Tax=Aldersonia sp. NBC_00410 TaxID=2975954 RepID=UPI00224CD3CC|nr:TetR/AcrR family transcriptional regulator [Aldersonia sp. NBC_00410]MCX5042253.1 TetR/AcrR family transcriptional regulator [Aldersonia sp. NBC_00410]